MKRAFAWIKKIPKKYFLILGFLLLILFIIASRRPSLPRLQFATVKRGDIQSTIGGSGTLTGKNAVDLRFKTGGRLTYLRVKPGDTVRRGQVIASLDVQDLSIALQEALNTLRDREATVQKIYDELKGHEADETFAQRAYRTTAEVAKDNAYDAVRMAKRAFQDTVVTAPISGIVSKQDNLEPGQFVMPTNLIAQVVDFSVKEIETDIDESDIGKIKVGQAAEATLNAYGDKVFKGVVSKIVPAAKTSTTGATTVVVKVRLTDPKIESIYGLNGQVNIIVSQKKDVLIIPVDALTQEENEVYVKTQNGVEKRKVEVGIMSETEAEIISGLEENDQVVINPSAVTPTNTRARFGGAGFGIRLGR